MLGHAVILTVAFAAGIVVGIYLRENEMVKVDDIKRGAKWIVIKTTGSRADKPQLRVLSSS